MNPETDLELSRILAATPAQVWRCWTEPDLLEQWFAPRPAVTRDARIDLRPGGAFATTMDVPDHGTHVNEGCFLELVRERKLVWTDLMHADWQPASGMFGFTAVILLEPAFDGKTRYTARALHKNAEICKSHADMGFHQGWGQATDQLEALARTL